MEAMADIFVKYLYIDPSVKRMDGLMVSSSCKKMSRLEILYTCVANMVRTINQTGEVHLIKSMEQYLKEDHRNEIIYHRKNEDLTSRLQQVIDDANNLISTLDETYFDFQEYQLLRRVLVEQTQKNADGNIIAKCKKQISTASLQNPSNPDATYRKKAGKDHKGYAGNLVETFDENGAIITSYDYRTNNHSDSSFCKETIEKLGVQETNTTLIADGAFSSKENMELAAQNNIELITTALIGKTPDIVQADFSIDPQSKEVTKCPAGQKPYKTRYYEATEMYRASFSKSTCINCPLKEHCGVKFQKKSSFVMVSEKRYKEHPI